MSNEPSLDRLPAGKIPPAMLASFLGQLPSPEDVIVGAAPGEDAAVLAVGDRYLVLAMDPVTMSARPARFAVEVNANDIAVMGATPRWLLASVVLPAGTDATMLRSLLDELRQGCDRLGVLLIGGHTEISPSVHRPIVTACMIGDVTPNGLVRSQARAGDALILAGKIALEGTAILGGEYAGELRNRGVADAVIAEAASLLDTPGISVVPAVRALLSMVQPHAMHDPTEGGIATAIREMAEASAVGVRFDAGAVPVLPACREICEAAGIDPLALLASGSLLAAIAPADVSRALEGLRGAGIPAAVIGHFVPPQAGFSMVRAGNEQDLPIVARDELARWEEGIASQ